MGLEDSELDFNCMEVDSRIKALWLMLNTFSR